MPIPSVGHIMSEEMAIEQMVEDLASLRGYNTKTNVPYLKADREQDSASDIDVLARSWNDEILAVECKSVEELGRWVGYSFPANTSTRKALEESLPAEASIEEWWLSPSGDPVEKPPADDRDFADEILAELRSSPGIEDVMIAYRNDEWGASIEVADDGNYSRKPRLLKGPFQMKSEGVTADTYEAAICRIALKAADAGIFPPDEGVAYRISRSGAKTAR
jgi:hypothetical protein